MIDLGNMLLRQIGLVSIASSRGNQKWPKSLYSLATQIQHVGRVWVAKSGNVDHQCIENVANPRVLQLLGM